MVQCGTVWCGVVMCDQCHRVVQCGTVWCGVVMCDQCHRVGQCSMDWGCIMVWCGDVCSGGHGSANPLTAN